MTISILFIILLWFCKDAGVIPVSFAIVGTVLGVLAAIWSVCKTGAIGGSDKDD